MPNLAMSWVNWATRVPQSCVHRRGIWLLCEAVSLGWGLRTCLYLMVSWNKEEQCTDLALILALRQLPRLYYLFCGMGANLVLSLIHGLGLMAIGHLAPEGLQHTANAQKKGRLPVIMIHRHTTPQKGPCDWRTTQRGRWWTPKWSFW